MSKAVLSFKEYAVSLYGEPGVSEACLSLQDRDGLDVVMLLYLSWLGRYGIMMRDDSILQAMQAIEGWREAVVLPLRTMRNRMKSDIGAVRSDLAEPLRGTVKKAELEAELIQIDVLQRLSENLPGRDGRSADRAGIIRSNFSRYLGLLDISRGADTVHDLEVIIDALQAT